LETEDLDYFLLYPPWQHTTVEVAVAAAAAQAAMALEGLGEVVLVAAAVLAKQLDQQTLAAAAAGLAVRLVQRVGPAWSSCDSQHWQSQL
jgi:hypothetical protein